MEQTQTDASTDVLGTCREFQAWRESLGLVGTEWAGFLARELGDCVSEPWIREELYVKLRHDDAKRTDFEVMSDLLGDVIAEASLAAKRDTAMQNGIEHNLADLALPAFLAGVKGESETPEQRLAREWGLSPAEAMPRGESWLHERKDWTDETASLRACLGESEREVRNLSAQKAAIEWDAAHSRELYGSKIQEANALSVALAETAAELRDEITNRHEKQMLLCADLDQREAEVAMLQTLAAQRYTEIERLSASETLLEQRLNNQAEYIEGLHEQLGAKDRAGFDLPVPVLCAAMVEIAPHIGTMEDDAMTADPQPETGCCDEFAEGDCWAMLSHTLECAEATQLLNAECRCETAPVETPEQREAREAWWVGAPDEMPE